MFSNKIDEINQLISNLYKDKKYTELKALSKLFSGQFLVGLEKILNQDCRDEEFFKEKYKISIGWIDKIPLASFVNLTKDINGNLINKKVELGDFLLVHSHSQTFQENKNTVIQNLDSRAVIVQAKLSKERHPNVPIGNISPNKVNSTSKELALLSNWPSFDLYQTSRSKTKLLSNVNLDPTQPNAKFAGYYNKQWEIGKPIDKDPCNESFGGLIMKMITKKEGQSFKENSTADDWDKLINKIITLCGHYNLPGYIFGKRKSRRWQTNNLYSGPIILFFFFSIRKKEKFPVLVINRIFYEGKFNQ